MAYSSVAHVSYLLVICLLPGESWVLIFYLAQYSASLILALLTVGCSGAYAGVAFAVSLLSMAGVPPFAGFFGKFFVFLLALEAGHVMLVVVGLVSSVVTAYYYLRIIGATAFFPAKFTSAAAKTTAAAATTTTTAAAAGGTLENEASQMNTQVTTGVEFVTAGVTTGVTNNGNIGSHTEYAASTG